MKENYDNLLKLTQDFHSPDQAEKIAKEIVETEAMLGSFTAPQPSKELLESITEEMHQASRKPKPVFTPRVAISSVISIAACLLIVAGILLNDNRPPVATKDNPSGQTAEWIALTAQADQALESITEELDSISDQLLSLQISDTEQISSWQLELEYLEDSQSTDENGFWKG